MAITLLSRVGDIYPAYNPFMVVLTSTNKNLTGFQYLVDLYNKRTGTLIRSLKLQPNPLNQNYGIADLGRIISDSISGNPMTREFSYCGPNTEQYVQVDIRMGEEYTYKWNMTDNAYNVNSPYIGRVGFTGSTEHQFIVGDYIQVTQNGTPTYTEYDGVHQVVSVPDNYYVVVDYPFLGNTGAEPGVITYLDLRRNMYTGLTTSSATFFDGVVADTYHTYAWEAWFPTGTTKFLTNIDDSDYKLRMTNNGFLNIAVPPNETSIQVEILDVTNNIGTQIGSTIITGQTLWWVARCPFAPASINSALGYSFLSSATQYKIFVLNSDEDILSEILTIDIDSTCTPYGSWTEILFEDQLGSYIPLNMRYVTKETTNISRKSHKRNLDYAFDGSNNYIYDINSQAYKIYSIDTSKEMTMHTGWLTETGATLVECLLKSKNVYWKDSNGYYIPCIITDQSYSKKTKLRNAVEIDYTITIIPQTYGDLNI